MIDVAVIGAGVSGLTAAWRLREAGLAVEVFEARSRMGGRAYTAQVQGHPVDLGATWVWDSERAIHALLRELDVPTRACASEGLDTYDDGTLQRGRLPTSAVAERRIVGGMATLMDALATRSGPVHLRCPVTALELSTDGIHVRAESQEVIARRVVAALPPSLVAPWLEEPGPLARVPVWMGEVAKCVGIFERSIWTEQGLSGRAFSRVGPMGEVHDLSSDGTAALFGFVHRQDAGDLERRVADQFQRLFGARPVHLHIQRWWDERYTTSNGVEDHGVFGHVSLRQPLLDGRLHLVSCETSGISPGHLDGAVERAEVVARELIAATR